MGLGPTPLLAGSGLCQPSSLRRAAVGQAQPALRIHPAPPNPSPTRLQGSRPGACVHLPLRPKLCWPGTPQPSLLTLSRLFSGLQAAARHSNSQESTTGQARELRPGEVMRLAQGCTAWKGQRPGSNSVSWLHPALRVRGFCWILPSTGCPGAQHSPHSPPPTNSATARSQLFQGGPQGQGPESPTDVLAQAAPKPGAKARGLVPDEEGGCGRWASGAPGRGAWGWGDQGCRAGPAAAPHLGHTIRAQGGRAISDSVCHRHRGHCCFCLQGRREPRKGQTPLLRHLPPHPEPRTPPRGPGRRGPCSWEQGRSAPGEGMPAQGLTLPPLPHPVPETQWLHWSGQTDRDPVPLIPGLPLWEDQRHN